MTTNNCNYGLDAYQDDAASTAIYPKEAKFLYTALGMGGESGEVAKLVLEHLETVKKPNDLIKECVSTLKDYCKVAAKVEKLKKDVRKKRGVATEENLAELAQVIETIPAETLRKLIDETGDVLWYVANMASDIDISLSSIGLHNKQKLKARSQNDELADRK